MTTAPPARVVPLADAGRDCGNKAHALAVLIRAGLPVPAGFVVLGPVDAATLSRHLDGHRNRHLDEHGDRHLDEHGDRHLDGHRDERRDRHLDVRRAEHSDPRIDEHSDRRIDGHRDRQIDGYRDSQLDEHSDRHLDEHGDRHLDEHGDRRIGLGSLAVRSSGLGEDSATASFAGQLETVLGVQGVDEVLAAVRRCARLTDRVRSYGAHPEDVPVIVQRLVRADTAGVLFTCDPRDGADVVLINAAPGLGDGVVSGSVVPDEIVVDVDGNQTESTCLTKIDIQRLAVLGRRCAEIFGAPQDVEWAIEGDTIWVLQSRPITAIGPPAATAPHRRGTPTTPQPPATQQPATQQPAATGQQPAVTGQQPTMQQPSATQQSPTARRSQARQQSQALQQSPAAQQSPATGRPPDTGTAGMEAWTAGPPPATERSPASGQPPPASRAREGREALATGVPCSPGLARGPVRVIRSVDEFGRLRRGDVLVCRTTDPAWTPLFRVAAAVVTETGGALSHAAIVAREYGIPAIAGVESAMHTLRDGADVEVDGTAGAIRPGDG
ncbi:PEP/pyruvate-binding domain-containing protein [Dactylosporangium matsuzakiense]|uniref:Pyruvate, water dikinase n=1 Tax=Dactylosporangium matsuzakiense TaxID=53360 RepID=A0A9W6KQH9_9ACTN|nr:PEP/pyruvate-binding domain-containing protein [Dactylosporangium matsuzakiense]UWZ40974.1 hypothetical protein Dmats_24930 [Dactylosporangium matsuzakiense]GLL04819.1 hypothetical protein GCM10017581_065660 [Dactylosporangium matsuzakiense]